MMLFDTHHLKSERTVYHEQYEIGDFPNVDHTIEVVVTFNKGESFFLAADYCNWSFCFIQCLFCVDQGSLPTLGGPTMAMMTGVGSD